MKEVILKCCYCGLATLEGGQHPCQIRCFVCDTWMLYPILEGGCETCDARVECMAYPPPIGWDPKRKPHYTIKGMILDATKRVVQRLQRKD